MQQAKADLLVPVIASLVIGALVSGGMVYALTSMDDADEAPATIATPTATATPDTTASPTTTPTTTKEFTYNGKILFTYPAEYTIIQDTTLPGGGGSALNISFGVTSTAGMVEKLPVTINQTLHGDPAEAPSLESMLDSDLEDKKNFTNSTGTKALTAKYVGMGDYYQGVVTGKNSGWSVKFQIDGVKATTGYSEAKLKTLFDQIMDTISL